MTMDGGSEMWLEHAPHVIIHNRIDDIQIMPRHPAIATACNQELRV